MNNNFDKKDNMSFTQQAEQLVNDYMQSKLDSKINALNAAIYKHNQDNKNYYSKNNNKNKNNDFTEYQISNQQANFFNTSRGQMQYSKNNKRISKSNKTSKSSDMTNLILNICLLCTMSMIMVLVYQICF